MPALDPVPQKSPLWKLILKFLASVILLALAFWLNVAAREVMTVVGGPLPHPPNLADALPRILCGLPVFYASLAAGFAAVRIWFLHTGPFFLKPWFPKR